MPDWSVVENASECDIATLSEGVFSFGRALAVGGEARPIACFLREEGAILAGASGRTEYERLFVSLLWVVDRLRCRGIGAEVLARLEEAATERGCRDALIETMNDRTAALYIRCGYRPIATIPRYVGPFTRHILVKTLLPVLPSR